MRSVSVTPTIGVGAYGAADAVGGLLDFDGIRQPGGGGGEVVSVRVVDESGQGAAMRLHLFGQTFTAAADNAPFDVSDADAANYIGSALIAAADWEGGATNQFAQVAVNIPFGAGAQGDESLYGQLEVDGAQTFGAADALTVTVVAS